MSEKYDDGYRGNSIHAPHASKSKDNFDAPAGYDTLLKMQTKESGVSPTVTLHKAFNAKHNVSEADDDEGRVDNIPYLN